MFVGRRTLMGAGLAAVGAAVTGCGEPEPRSLPGRVEPDVMPPSPSPIATASVSPSGQAPYAADVTKALRRYLPATSQTVQHHGFPGAVALVLVDGRPTVHTAVGEALRYEAGPKLLPPARRVPMRPDSIFDLASITKVYTAILLLQQVEQGRVALDAAVAEYLPGFTGTGKRAVTVAMLLTHTGGLAPAAKVTGLPDNAARWQAVLAAPLVSGAKPGSTFRYSSVGVMVAGKIIEQVTGRRLDQVLKSDLTEPLGLRDTGFTPNTRLPADVRRTRLVATDARSPRGLLRGTVHDDVANHLGGIAGHAGLFASAADVAAIGQLLLDGGVHQGRRLLAEATVQQMLVNANAGKPAVDRERPYRTSAHGLGVVLDQRWFMGGLTGPRTFGHTGFAGPSLVVDPDRRLVLALLTNRAHPNWSWADPDPARVAVADVLAKAVG
ncbi:serine hydrolase domain-containing protein [Catellatospora vulcania]|uniref:serine hydrolase domain-containing protein n=1 Tax=Catellatospora vulcania TaxID=1460450 RepID=UPI0012D434CB|nr:serine hydrolase domain-containing protein [Catellatospora vulcania]